MNYLIDNIENMDFDASKDYAYMKERISHKVKSPVGKIIIAYILIYTIIQITKVFVG